MIVNYGDSSATLVGSLLSSILGQKPATDGGVIPGDPITGAPSTGPSTSAMLALGAVAVVAFLIWKRRK